MFIGTCQDSSWFYLYLFWLGEPKVKILLPALLLLLKQNLVMFSIIAQEVADTDGE